MAGWPAAETERLGEWVFRAAGGYTRRANSVQPHGDPGVPLDEAITRARTWFADRGLPCVFKMTPAAAPFGLDDALEAAGFLVDGHTRTMTRSLAGDAPSALAAAAESGVEFQSSGAATVEWHERFEAWNEVPPARSPLHRQILDRVEHGAFGVIHENAELRACGLAVRDGDWVGLFDLVVDPAHRSRGLGTVLLQGLCAWGRGVGAGHTYLQVMDRNAGARRLYERLGFVDRYPYWYRSEPDQA